MEKAIIVDTEYTTWPGALESGWREPGQHREIVQIAAIKIDENFQEIESFDVLVRPTINSDLSPLFVELTGITGTMVETKGKSFTEQLGAFYNFCEKGLLPLICMNADEAVFRDNCSLNKTPFPFLHSWHRLRPYLESLGINLSQISSGDLHRLTSAPLSVGHTHYALHDVRSMGRWMEDAQQKGLLTSLSQLPTGAPAFDPRSKQNPTNPQRNL